MLYKCKSKYNRNSEQCLYISHSLYNMGMHLRMHRDQFEQMKLNERHTSNNHGIDANRDNVNDIQSQPFNEVEIVVQICSSDDETMQGIDARRRRTRRYKSLVARVAAQSNVPVDIIDISSDDETH